jgi:hypothetical protein
MRLPVTRLPGPDTRRRALAHAAQHWGTVTVVVRGRFATQWVATSRAGESPHEPPRSP